MMFGGPHDFLCGSALEPPSQRLWAARSRPCHSTGVRHIRRPFYLRRYVADWAFTGFSWGPACVSSGP
eukprot:6508194-Pyramimonas_sp.AAC.1